MLGVHEAGEELLPPLPPPPSPSPLLKNQAFSYPISLTTMLLRYCKYFALNTRHVTDQLFHVTMMLILTDIPEHASGRAGIGQDTKWCEEWSRRHLDKPNADPETVLANFGPN